jgi:hypothetical protein
VSVSRIEVLRILKVNTISGLLLAAVSFNDRIKDAGASLERTTKGRGVLGSDHLAFES